MSIFDVASTNGVQSAATTVATSLVPKRQASVAADLQSLGATGLSAKAATTTTGTTAATTGTATITSNDFLTLLVSELKNQDPTQPTDPNAYISQLVGVNSLQQLISINQGISTIDSATTGDDDGNNGDDPNDAGGLDLSHCRVLVAWRDGNGLDGSTADVLRL